jgi:hypothetical protein
MVVELRDVEVGQGKESLMEEAAIPDVENIDQVADIYSLVRYHGP